MGGSVWRAKFIPTPKAALDGMPFDGMTVMAGGFGLRGNPENLIAALREDGVKNITIISNNCGADNRGLWVLLDNGQIKKMISSYVGENKLFESLYLSGKLELELNPQGTLAERIRAGGAGIPAFYTKTGVGTVVAEGKPTEDVRRRDLCARNAGCAPILSIVKAWKGDSEGNLVYRKTARNFNPMIATAGKITIAEVEELVEPGQLDADGIHTPGIYRHSASFRAATTRNISSSAPCGRGRKRQAPDGLDPRTDGGARRARIERRLLRQSGHRHSHPGGQLHSRRHEGDAAERERHAGDRAVSL